MEKTISNLTLEAKKIIKDLKLIPMLKQYGKAEIVGSVALNLVIKKDIDIHVFLDSNDFLKIAHEISNNLLARSQIDEVRISDWREIDSMKVSVDDFEGPSGKWDIEIWLTTKKDSCGFDLVKRLKQELTDEKRKIIMKLKQYFYKKGMLRNGISRKIYLAVMDKDIKTIEEFKKHYKRNC